MKKYLLFFAIILFFSPRFLTASQPDSIAMLINQLKSTEIDEKREAAWKLGDLGEPKAVQPLIDALNDKDVIVRRGAAKSLGQISDRRSILPLIKAAKGGNVNASWAFKNGNFTFNESNIESLISLLKNSSDTKIQMNIAAALGFTKNIKVVNPLIAHLKSKNIYVRKNAALALG